MSFEATRIAIETHLAGINLGSGIPVEWEGGGEKGGAPLWARWTIRQGEVNPAVLGEGHTRGTGMVTLQVFMRDKTGVGNSTRIADLVAAALDRVQLRTGSDVITFGVCSMADTDPREGYLQKNITCIFRRDTYE